MWLKLGPYGMQLACYTGTADVCNNILVFLNQKKLHLNPPDTTEAQ